MRKDLSAMRRWLAGAVFAVTLGTTGAQAASTFVVDVPIYGTEVNPDFFSWQTSLVQNGEWARSTQDVRRYPIVDLQNVDRFRFSPQVRQWDQETYPNGVELTLGYSIDGGSTWHCLGPVNCVVWSIVEIPVGGVSTAPTPIVNLPFNQRRQNVLLAPFWRPVQGNVVNGVLGPQVLTFVAQLYRP